MASISQADGNQGVPPPAAAPPATPSRPAAVPVVSAEPAQPVPGSVSRFQKSVAVPRGAIPAISITEEAGNQGLKFPTRFFDKHLGTIKVQQPAAPGQTVSSWWERFLSWIKHR